MRKYLKTSQMIFFGAVVIVVTLALFDQNNSQHCSYSDIKAVKDPNTIQRGQYLVNTISECEKCHSSKEFGNSIKGDGSELVTNGKILTIPLFSFNAATDQSGESLSLKKYSDKQIAQIFRECTQHQTESANPILNYQNLNESDLNAVISYLRSLEVKLIII